MIYINKTAEPQSFTNWKNNNPNATYKELTKPKNKKIYIDLKKSLIEEQNGICCYCECKLIDDDSHIEHIKPRSKYKDLQLSYDNIVCSCQMPNKNYEQRHCAITKDNWFDEKLFISPLNHNCQNHFIYKADGHVFPRQPNDLAAIETIKHLELDCQKLVDNRFAFLDSFLDEALNEEERELFIQKYKELSYDNPPEYISTLKDVFPEYF